MIGFPVLSFREGHSFAVLFRLVLASSKKPR